MKPEQQLFNTINVDNNACRREEANENPCENLKRKAT